MKFPCEIFLGIFTVYVKFGRIYFLPKFVDTIGMLRRKGNYHSNAGCFNFRRVNFYHILAMPILSGNTMLT